MFFGSSPAWQEMAGRLFFIPFEAAFSPATVGSNSGSRHSRVKFTAKLALGRSGKIGVFSVGFINNRGSRLLVHFTRAHARHN